MAIALDADALANVGLPRQQLDHFLSLELTFPSARVASPGGLRADSHALSRYVQVGQALIDRLAPRAARSAAEQAAVDTLIQHLRAARLRFLRAYAAVLYAELTDDRRAFVRVEDLVFLAAEQVPGLVPTRAQIQGERALPQKDKDGFEVDQGVFLSQVLSDEVSGAHLVHAMLRPRPESLELLPDFLKRGRLDLGTTTVERQASVGYLYHGNPRVLNAEDDSTTSTLEIGTDLILLDPHIEVGVLRGKVVDHPKYAGRRIFNAGINLTHLYYGQISFVDFFIARDMGYLHKMYRGLSGAEFWPHEVENSEQEKPWIAAVEGFAIGGGCQLLLAMDHVLAEQSSFFNLPARKEGIVPGVSNMRLWRFVGDRAARQAILFERQFAADSPAGQLICDTVVPDGGMDAALGQTIAALTSSGVVSAAGNRKAMRIGQESIDLFRQYMALYCREQAYCHYSPQLIRNLEQNWNAHQRRVDR
ncbi:MAG TPA: enoyl-CoA hydratase/isomerase family protein [Chloroflexota bacterium]|nr:enoyl-CoA hydratase/isomerase family protein [Chloroflexota bacterium]